MRPLGVHGPFLGHKQLMDLWVHYGGNHDLANIMAAIALAESSGGQYSLGHNSNGSYDHGYWQDNWPHYYEPLFEPGNNTRRAILLAEQTPNGLANWTMFNNGRYKQYIGAAYNPITAAPGHVGVTDTSAETVDVHQPRDSHDYSPFIEQTAARHRRSADYLQQAASAFRGLSTKHARLVSFHVTEHHTSKPAPADHPAGSGHYPDGIPHRPLFGYSYPLGRAAKLIGTPYTGTHGKAFNVAGGSDNWESENAIDLGVEVGTPVYAVGHGTIGSQIGSLGSGGRFAGLRLHLITPGNEFYYAHLSRIVVHAGEHVEHGQLLGYSGEANGVAHLHLAAKHNNPQEMFA